MIHSFFKLSFRQFPSAMAVHQVDSEEALILLLKACRVPQAQIDHLVLMGFTTCVLLAHGVSDPSQLDAFVEHVSHLPDGATFNAFSSQSAALRDAVSQCIVRTQEAGRGVDVSQNFSQTPVPPKLTISEVREMRDRFMKSYPGELLTPSVMPSLPFLQLVKDQLDQGALSWVPWKSRTSESNELEFLERRKPRNDGQLLRSLLADGAYVEDNPEAKVPLHENPELVLGKFQQLFANCLVLLDACHLLVIKRYHCKFLEIATTKPRDSSLRPPSLSEILDGDRASWLAVCQLMRENKWSLNDSMNEIAFCRQDFYISLQPRLTLKTEPRLVKDQRKRPFEAKPNMETSPKKAKPGSPSASKAQQWDPSWPRKLPSGQGICIRYHMTKCKAGEACRYAHACPVPDSKGVPCAGNHRSSAHRAAPH